jgi:hypothetical protein
MLLNNNMLYMGMPQHPPFLSGSKKETKILPQREIGLSFVLGKAV